MTKTVQSIWFQPVDLARMNAMHDNTLAGLLGIELIEYGPDFLVGRMPVDERTVQPFGLLHGGASVVLAETLGSFAAVLTVDASRFQVVGQEINANHLRGVSSGHVTGTARPVHIGRRSQVWGTEIRDDQGRLACVSRLTVAVIERRSVPASL